MTSTIASVALALAMSATGGAFRHHPPAARVLPPGNNLGFPNGNPDGYGWFDYNGWLPLGADRTSDYYFQRHYATPPDQMFMSTYYNPYIMRGQRYIPYAGCGGDHPVGGPPLGRVDSPVHPYGETLGTGPGAKVPPFTGRVEASPINSGGSGLTP